MHPPFYILAGAMIFSDGNHPGIHNIIVRFYVFGASRARPLHRTHPPLCGLGPEASGAVIFSAINIQV